MSKNLKSKVKTTEVTVKQKLREAKNEIKELKHQVKKLTNQKKEQTKLIDEMKKFIDNCTDHLSVEEAIAAGKSKNKKKYNSGKAKLMSDLKKEFGNGD